MGVLFHNRIMDTILTDEGKRQIASGKFKPTFYSFGDSGAVYSPADTYVSGTAPSSSIATMFSLEAVSLPQDQVAFEADDSGALLVHGNNNFFQVPGGDTVRVIGGKLVKGWENGAVEVLSSSAEFSTLANSVLSGTMDNFKRLMILKSPDLLYPSRDEFKVSVSGAVEFSVSDNTYLPGNLSEGVLESTDNLFSDRKVSHIDNFSFLPPVNKGKTKPIGDYNSAINGNRQILSFEDLRSEFQNVVVQSGSVQLRSLVQNQTIRFSETSLTNRVMSQMFEVSAGKLTKLDVVDFGVFTIKKTDPPLFPDAVPQPLNPDVVTATTRIHVYFVGKVFLDNTGNHKFINMFTLVWQ